MEKLFELLKEHQKISKELLSFEVFTDRSGCVYSHCVGDEMEKYKWQESFVDIQDALYNMKIRNSFLKQ